LGTFALSIDDNEVTIRIRSIEVEKERVNAHQDIPNGSITKSHFEFFIISIQIPLAC